ncbi:MAG: RsmB/NOP family class I SAM-dependent RNA methyltransferase [Lachnospiraceae bacterium]|nr:RsmB/NOP family class I SAM-dependent RNA methyltransferase [Lachnospiraceae bacterium]
MDLPQDFLTRMEALLGEEFPAFLNSYGETRRYGLRVNTLKISVEEFQRIAPFHLTPIPWIENGFFYEKEDAPSRHPFYYAGLYYLQEPSAMTPAQVLPVCPGERVLDLCAAPGGKATALAVKLAGEGMLVANDISASRAKALLKNLELFGVKNAFVTNEIPAKLAAQYPEFFDKILVDAPCSGEGMFRKDIANAHAWSLAKVRDCAKTQKEIALQAVSMLRPGGMLLYSTCTFSPEEDEQVIAYILAHCPEMELLPIPMAEGFEKGRPELADEEWGNVLGGNTVCKRESRGDLTRCVRLFPHKIPGEGHFMALLKKSGSAVRGNYGEDEKILFSDKAAVQEKKDGKNREKKKEKTDRKVKKEKSTLRQGRDMAGAEFAAAFLKEQNQMEYLKNLELRGDRAYYVPDLMGASENTGGLHFLRNGLYLGEVKKDRFEPSQAFAMTLHPKESETVLNFDCADERVTRYLRGETLDVEDMLTGAADGWRLVCVNGFPLGWGRLTGSTLKNKYHPGWRIQ